MRAKEKTKVKRDESKQDKTVRQTKKGKITRAHICHKYHKILGDFARREVHYYMAFIAYYTESNFQISNYAQKRRI